MAVTTSISVMRDGSIQAHDLRGKRMRRVRKWGDPVMSYYGFDVDQVGTTNFQAVRCWNKETGFGAVSNFLRIPSKDMWKVYRMQVEDWTGNSPNQKMSWLCKYRGTIYMYDSPADSWIISPSRWGTLTLGGNLVQIAGFEVITLQMDSTKPARPTVMARLVGFTPYDWGKPLSELLAHGLVHRCYCAYKNNQFGDSPNGIVYSPFWSPLYWDFTGTKQPSALYIPEVWLEDE